MTVGTHCTEFLHRNCTGHVSQKTKTKTAIPLHYRPSYSYKEHFTNIMKLPEKTVTKTLIKIQTEFIKINPNTVCSTEGDAMRQS